MSLITFHEVRLTKPAIQYYTEEVGLGCRLGLLLILTWLYRRHSTTYWQWAANSYTDGAGQVCCSRGQVDRLRLDRAELGCWRNAAVRQLLATAADIDTNCLVSACLSNSQLAVWWSSSTQPSVNVSSGCTSYMSAAAMKIDQFLPWPPTCRKVNTTRICTYISNYFSPVC